MGVNVGLSVSESSKKMLDVAIRQFGHWKSVGGGGFLKLSDNLTTNLLEGINAI